MTISRVEVLVLVLVHASLTAMKLRIGREAPKIERHCGRTCWRPRSSGATAGWSSQPGRGSASRSTKTSSGVSAIDHQITAHTNRGAS
jgi:hypothetical protein